MKCKKCGRYLDIDANGVLYHECDLMWVVEPNCIGLSGIRIPLPGAKPAEKCSLPPLK